MRLAIDTSSISFRFLGNLLLVTGVISLAGGLFARLLVAVGLLSSIAGVLLRRSRLYIVRHRPAAVLKQLAATLELMEWKYDRQDDSISVPATGTLVEVKPLLSLTLLSFKFRGKDAQRENYLAATLVKYQRFI
jgi:hypothetical protein